MKLAPSLYQSANIRLITHKNVNIHIKIVIILLVLA